MARYTSMHLQGAPYCHVDCPYFYECYPEGDDEEDEGDYVQHFSND